MDIGMKTSSIILTLEGTGSALLLFLLLLLFLDCYHVKCLTTVMFLDYGMHIFFSPSAHSALINIVLHSRHG